MAIFVGDLIDRGDGQLAVLTAVRAMVDDGHAIALMGNHEFNAVCWSIEDGAGGWLREHDDKNEEQHEAFLTQIPDERERAEWIAWFAELPLWHVVGDDELRVAHACWHTPSIDSFEKILGGRVIGDRPELWVEAANRGSDLGNAIEIMLKGPELDLTRYGMKGCYDGKGRSNGVDVPTGKVRHEARIRWWISDATTLDQVAEVAPTMFNQDEERYGPIPALPLEPQDKEYPYSDEIPVIYGHHWREWEPTEHLDHTTYTACVDFSAGKQGPLVAYRWNGEPTIDVANYVRFDLR